MRAREHRSLITVAAATFALVLAAGMPVTAADAQSAGRHGHGPSGATAVLDWTAIAETTVATGRGPGPSQALMAIVAIGLHDTVAAFEGSSEPYAVAPKVRRPTSLAAAVATVAHGILVARAPEQADSVGAQYRAYLDAIPNTKSKLNGIRLGVEVADAILTLRAADGLNRSVPYIQPPPGPGIFEPVAPTPPVGTELALVTPFAMASPDQLRPDGPDQLDSAEYAGDFNEVKAFGSAESDQRTAEQTETALFWSDHGFLQWSRALRAIAAEQRLDAAEAARMLALVHVAAADGGIACFDAKYHYLSWRPIHAIQRADTDGNDATEADPSWQALLTVNHPEYPSGAGCVNGAIVETLATFFETDHVAFAVDSLVTGTERHYQRFSDALAEDLDARVWSGLHFRNSMDEAAEVGRAVSGLVTDTLFRPSRTHR